MKNLDPANDKNLYEKQSGDEKNLDSPNVVKKQCENLKYVDPSIVKNQRNVDGKQSQNIKNRYSPPIATIIQDVGEEQSQNMQNTDFSVIVNGYADEKNAENKEDLDLAEKGECRRETVKYPRDVKLSRDMIALDSPSQQESQKQSENLEYLDTPAIVRSLREMYEQPENIHILSNVLGGGYMKSESFKNITSPAIIKNINEVSDKQKNVDSVIIGKNLRSIGDLQSDNQSQKIHKSEDTKNVDTLLVQDTKQSENEKNIDSLVIGTTPRVGGKQLKNDENSALENDLQAQQSEVATNFDPINVNSLRDFGGKQSEKMENLDSSTLVMNPHGVVENQPESMHILDSTTVTKQGGAGSNRSKNMTNLQVIGQKQSESMKNLNPAIVKNLFNVTYTLSENLDSLEASEIVKNLHDLSDEQSEYLENIDLPVMVKKKYLENLKNLDLAERGE